MPVSSLAFLTVCRSVRQQKREDVIQLFVVPVKVHRRVVLGFCIGLLPEDVEVGFFVGVFDPVQKLLEVLVRPEAILQLELEVPEHFLIPVEVRNFLEGFGLGHILLLPVILAGRQLQQLLLQFVHLTIEAVNVQDELTRVAVSCQSCRCWTCHTCHRCLLLLSRSCLSICRNAQPRSAAIKGAH